MTRGKIVLDGKSKENLEKICGIQFFFLVFLSFRTVCAYPRLRQRQKIRFTIVRGKAGSGFGQSIDSVLGKLVRFLRKICHRSWGNPSPILGKSATYFREICPRLWGNPSATLGKSVPDFGEIRQRLWEICPRLWGNPSATLGKSVPDFGEICPRLWENPVSYTHLTLPTKLEV